MIGIGTSLVIGGTLLAGTLLGGLLDNFSIGGEQHAPYETFMPQYTLAPVISTQHPDYQIQIDSPGAFQTSKKTMKTEADIRPTQSYAPSETAGIPIIPIAIIGAIALIGISYVKKD